MKTKPDKPPPPQFKLGAGAHYTRIDVLADMLGCSEKGIRSLFAIFEIPVCHFPGMADSYYVLTYAFESAMFNLGMPKGVQGSSDLLRVHQELAGVLYGTLTKEALKERVKKMIKQLTSPGNKATIGRDKKAKRRHTWAGRTPS